MPTQQIPFRITNNGLLSHSVFDGSWETNTSPSPLSYGAIPDQVRDTSLQLPYYSTYEHEHSTYLSTHDTMQPYDLSDMPDSPQSVSHSGFPNTWSSSAVNQALINHDHSVVLPPSIKSAFSQPMHSASDTTYETLAFHPTTQPFAANELEIPQSTMTTYDAVDQVLLEISADDSERFSHAFWSRIHATFPMTNRASRIWSEPCTLRSAAMQALGASALGSLSDLALASTLYDACLKSLYTVGPPSLISHKLFP